MRFVGIDYPKRHDVSSLITEMKDRFPDWFETEKLAEESSWLAQRREPSMYGDENAGTGPDQLFTKKDTSLALIYSKEIFKACKRLVHQR